MASTRPFVVFSVLAAGLAAACGQGAATAEGAAVDSAATAPAEAAPTRLATLPLKRGYYVASDVPCGKASNADVVLVRRDGMGGSRDSCEFLDIKQTGPDTYRVTEACADFQSDAPPESNVVTYTIPDDSRFTSQSEHGWTHSARHCPQSSMPPEWRENDISDVTG